MTAARIALLCCAALAGACRAEPSRRADPVRPRLVAPRIEPRQDARAAWADRIAAADRRMDEARAHSSWPTPGDRERWQRDIDAADAARATLDAAGASADDAAFAVAAEAYENAAAVAYGGVTLLRLGDRARNRR